MLEPAQIKLEPADIKQEPFPDSTTGNSPKKKAGRPKKLKQEKITDHVTVKKKRKVDRFKGMPEEEVITRLLPDHLAPNLDIVIVGINPGLYAAFVGHHYAGPGNHFWKCMYLSGLIPEPMTAMQDFKLLDYGIGFTNIVARTTRGSADLTRKEIKEGAQILTEKLLKYKPKIAVFNGKGIYEVFVGHKNFHFGKQPDLLPGTETAVYVMPSSSARCSQLPRAVDKVPFYEALKKFRDHLKGNLPDLKESEITFEDVVLKTAVKKEVKQEGEDQYPGEMGTMLPGTQIPGSMGDMSLTGDQQLAQFMSGSYQVIPHSVQSSSSQGMINQSSPVCISNAGTSPGVSSTLQTVQVKQEPVDSDCPSTSCQATTSQSETISIGQLEVYNQSQSTSQSDSHLNNFLNGLYGMVNQVAGSSQADSRYGVVNHALPGITTNGPVQFNDALRDIVRESTTDDIEPSTSLEVLEKPSTSQQSQGKTAKSSKPRKRKSKSIEESPAMSPPATFVPPHEQHYNHHSSSPPGNQQNSFQSFHPVPPFTSHMPHPNMPGPGYSNAYMSQMQGQYNPHMAYNYMQSQHSFTQMMNSGEHFMGMPSHGNTQNFPQQHISNGFQGQYPNIEGQQPNGFNPNMPIKQEKTDN
ncbi:uncharacterized protein LOC123530305 [Mercenaria mercenaria]|uniref:uncharacterized protein LOC123530305 n=1 Tax=Mercenaria mercenaria TaxID=6596 RepID=UPI00234F7B52|nr:uncharacterized protein LOC123530305 [Mercenaria mercenaria]XP_053377898.1 uncharacterized protein LOC123530305 [Mercenaria mercenaria]